LHVVGRRATIELGDDWGNEKPCNRLVAIGASGNFDGDAIKMKFAA
jgi:hypothetical protein